MAALIREILDWLRTGSVTPQPPPLDRAVPGVSLALGGGFARGFAHLGVLQVLEEERIPVRGIAGSSVGSILGAAYASGVPLARIMDVCRNVRLRDFSKWRISRMGLASNERMAELIQRWFQALRFEDLRIPLAVVTTDLTTGEACVFTKGSIVDPIRASCAYPGLFEPVQIGQQCLADGGLVAPVPTQAAGRLPGHFVLGVNVGFNRWNAGPPTNVFQVVSRAINAAQKYSDRMWERHANLMIEPEVQEIEWNDFQKVEEAIQAGKAAMRRSVTRVRELLEQPRREKSRRVTPITRAVYRRAV
jgi:NTE family protein